MEKLTRITVNTGDPKKAIDAQSLFEHLARALGDYDLRNVTYLDVDEDGTVYYEGRIAYTPPKSLARGAK